MSRNEDGLSVIISIFDACEVFTKSTEIKGKIFVPTQKLGQILIMWNKLFIINLVPCVLCWFSCDCFFLFIFICLSVCCYHQGQGTAQIGEGGDNSWIVLDDDDDDDDKEMKDNDEIEIADEKTMTPDTVTQSSQQKNGSKGEKKTAFYLFYIIQKQKNC